MVLPAFLFSPMDPGASAALLNHEVTGNRREPRGGAYTSDPVDCLPHQLWTPPLGGLGMTEG